MSDEFSEDQVAEAGAGAPADAGPEQDQVDPATEAGPAEPTEPGAEADPANDAGEAADEAAVEHDIEDLVAQARAERDEYLNLAQRTKADFENFRKRMNAEKAEAGRRGRLEVVPGLIEALDNLERVLDNEGIETANALNSGMPDGAPVSLQGVIVAYRDLHSTLKRIDVLAYDPAGEAFDPNLHEALQAVPTEGVEAGVVVEVMQRGYRSDEHVIRPARVVVSQ